MRILLFTFILILSARTDDDQEPDGIESEEGDPEVIYNKTYQESQSALTKKLFSNYLKYRPVKNDSQVTEIMMHFHILHLTVDEDQQTMSVNGHLFMSWKDEFLGWDPMEFSGIRMTRCRQWSIWNPALKIGNSVTGVQTGNSISKSAPVTLTTKAGGTSATVELFPTINAKVGCTLDFSKFPYDSHECFIRIHSMKTMSDVTLSYYEEEPPSLALGWGSQKNKSMVGNFQFTGVNIKNEYFDSREKFSYTEPVTAQERGNTWAILKIGIKFRRNHVLFNIGFLLPCIVTAIFSTLAFFLPKLDHAASVLVCNLFLHSIFLHEFVIELPKGMKALPGCLIFYSSSLIWNLLAITFHLLFRRLWTVKTEPPPAFQSLGKLEICGKATTRKADAQEVPWSRVVRNARTILGVFTFSTYFVAILYFFTPPIL